MLLAVLAAAWVIVFEFFFVRRSQRKAGTEPAPLWVSVVKVVILAVLILVAGWLFATGRAGTSFPISGIILLVLVILYTFVTRNTVFGRHIYAVGGNRQAARLSGVKDRWADFFVMMNMSVLASVAGMIYVARATASGPQDGNGWELDAIASVFIGGAAVSGGIGTVIGSIIGGLVMAFLNNGMALLGAGADVVSMVKGLVLLLAVGVDVWNKQQGRPVPHRVHHPPVRPQGRAVSRPPLPGNDEREVGESAAPRRFLPAHTKRERDHMKKILLSATAIVVAGAFALTGCSSSDRGGSPAASGDSAKGFAADAKIGVALPDKTSENWVLAGKLFTDGLTKAGFKPDVQYAPASNTVAEQQNQIQAMVTGGAKVIIIGAKDGKQLSTQVKAAHDAGVTVIAYDRLIENTDAVDYYVAFDNFKVGQLQGQALLDGLAKRAGHPAPYNIELFSGSAGRRELRGLLQRRDGRAPAEDQGRHAQGRVGSDRHHPDRDRRLEGRERAAPHGRDPHRELQLGHAGRRPVPERHPRPRHHHLGAAGRQARPGRHRSGLRGRVGEVDHGGRAVLHDQQGHVPPGRAGDQDGRGSCRRAPRSTSTTPSRTTTA